MYKERKNYFDKLDILVRNLTPSAISGEVFPNIYNGDFVSDLPCERYLDFLQKVPEVKVYDVREYGAVPNDKNRLAHGAINGVIDICSKNGGGVILVSGGDYHCQTVMLKSNVILFVDKGSSLVASLDSKGYKHGALIYCENSKNITVTGGGKIRGNGESFNLAPENQPFTQPAPIIDIVEMVRERQSTLRSHHKSAYESLVTFSNCFHVCVNNFMFENSAGSSIRLFQCNDVKVSNIVVNNNRHISATDGIVILQSNKVRVKKCFISTGGSGVCLKNAVWQGCYGTMFSVNVTDCEIQAMDSAFKIGDETTSNITGVTVENCKFRMTDVFPGTMSGISIASFDGADVRNVTVRNVEMDRVICPVFLRLSNRNRAYNIDENERSIELNAKIMKRLNPKEENVFDWKSQLRNIKIENINATNVEMPIVIAGIFDVKKGIKYIKNINLSGINMSYRKCKEVYERRVFIPESIKGQTESWEFKNLPAYGIWARHVMGLNVSDFNCTPARVTWKERVIFEDVKK